MHAYVLVLGEHPETMLEPYLENSGQSYSLVTLETLDSVSNPRDTLALIAKRAKEDPVVVVDSDMIYAENGDLKEEVLDVIRQLENPTIVVVENGVYSKLERYYDTGFYDWYCVGGRWNGLLVLKEGSSTPQTPAMYQMTHDRGLIRLNDTEHLKGDEYNTLAKKDIDFDAMKTRFRESIYYRYNKALIEHLGDLTWPISYINDEYVDWKAFHESVTGLKVKNFQYNHKLEPTESVDFLADIGIMTQPAEDRLEILESLYICPQILLTESGYVRRRMGWHWDMTDLERMGRLEWANHVLNTIAALPDDTLLTVVDIHH